MESKIIQMPTSRVHGELQLVPPLADEFSVYGNPETVERARTWALDGHYLLAQGVPACAHGMYLMNMCPNNGCRTAADLDHVNLWVPETGRPFLLHHPYDDEISDRTRAYARAHGLDATAESPRDYVSPELASAPFRDDWYGGSTIAVRLSISSDWPMWPIEAEAAAQLKFQLQQWPDPEEVD